MLARKKNSANVTLMQLEDHLGDIIRKARMMSAVAPAAAALAANISETDLAALEDSGVLPPKINLPALAQTLGLDPKKFQTIARGWLPVKTDLTRWRELRPFVSSGDGLSVNCYLIWDAATREAALFDTGVSNPFLPAASRARWFEIFLDRG